MLSSSSPSIDRNEQFTAVSGFEVIGLVLDLFPRFGSALELYRTGHGVLQPNKEAAEDIAQLHLRVAVQYHRLLNLLKLLLEPAGVGIANVVEWNNTKMTASGLDTLLNEWL